MMRFIIFVDGSNLWGSLKKLNLHITRYEDLFSHILKSAIDSWSASIVGGEKSARLIRILWYMVSSIDEWDLNDQKVAETLRGWFNQETDLKKKYLALAGTRLYGADQEKIHQEAWSICFNEIKQWYSSKKLSIKKSHDFQFGVQSTTDFIDIVTSGHLRVDILNKNVTEKGIDTSLAVDMLSLADTYDVALLISGDADSIPSVQRVKHEGKHIGMVEFIKGHPPEQRGRSSSSKLKATADFVVPIYEVDLLKNGIATIPGRGEEIR